MRNAFGAIIKGVACIFLTALIVVCIAFSNQLELFGLSPQPHEYIAYGALGVLLSLLLYAYGQSVQSLAEMAQQQAASRRELESFSLLLRDHPAGTVFANPSLSMYASTGSLLGLETAAPKPASDWRRPVPEVEPNAATSAPSPEASMESAADLPQPIPELSFPLAAEECLPQQGTVSAPPQLETAVPAPLLKVACSLCKTIQDAGQLYCIHCGAMFINDMTA